MIRSVSSLLLETAWALAFGLAVAPQARAASRDLAVTNVTTRAFSVVWASDEPVLGASLRVFADPGGSVELTGDLSFVETSASVPGAHLLGLAGVDVRGLAAGSCYFVQSQTTTAGGLVSHPSSPPYPEACTGSETRATDDAHAPISNDVLVHEVVDPAAGGALPGALVVVEVPDTGAYPLSAFVGEAGQPFALTDLNNLFESDTGRTAAPAPGERLRIRALRGLACPDPAWQEIVRFGRIPAHEELAATGEALTGAERPAACFPADPLCDDVVDLLDAQWLLNVFDTRAGSCDFLPHLDLVPDGVINILDVQRVLNHFGETGPFEGSSGGGS